MMKGNQALAVKDFSKGAYSAPLRFKVETTAFIKPATSTQRAFIKAIKNNDLVVAFGPSGVGKTLLALHTGVQLLNNDWSPIERIVYVRSNVASDEEKDIGFLPGDKHEKVRPLAYPILDNMIQFVKRGQVDYLLQTERIEVMTTSMMRGRSFSNCFVLMDEMQNASPASMKTCLTRLGDGSKMVIIGDPKQKDTRFDSGLEDLIYRIRVKGKIDSVETIQFTKEDIVRHHAIARILELYNE